MSSAAPDASDAFVPRAVTLYIDSVGRARAGRVCRRAVARATGTTSWTGSAQMLRVNEELIGAIIENQNTGRLREATMCVLVACRAMSARLPAAVA
jgi:hypothetical protein